MRTWKAVKSKAEEAKEDDAGARTFNIRLPPVYRPPVYGTDDLRRREKYSPFVSPSKSQKSEAEQEPTRPDLESYFQEPTADVAVLLDHAGGYSHSLAGAPIPGKEPNLVSSIVDGIEGNPESIHFPVLDFDFPCRLVPSQTEGHFHLYIDKPVRWDAFVDVMWAMAEAGLLEPGWVGPAIQQGFAAVRPSMSHLVAIMKERIEAGEDPSEVFASLDFDKFAEQKDNDVPF